MNPDVLFSLTNAWILPAWLLLVIIPKWKYTPHIVIAGAVLPLAICYSFLLFTSLDGMDTDTFSSLENISNAFESKKALLTGWVHYLAFDLFVGLVITYDSIKQGIPVIPRLIALFFTLMAGPFGWLLYFIIRLVKTGNFNPDLTTPVTVD
jgi:hypothetical protein